MTTDPESVTPSSVDDDVLEDFNDDPLDYLSPEQLDATYMALERISQTRREAEVQSQNLRVG